MALGQALNASVGQGAPCEQSRGVVFTYVEIHIHTHIYIYTYAHVRMLATSKYSSLGCFGLHVDLVEQNNCSSKYME